MEKLIELDKELFIYLHGHHAQWLDQVMLFLTQTIAWIPLYAVLLYMLFREYKKEVWIALIAIVLTIVIADQTTSSLMKPYFARLRPSHEPSLEGVVHLARKASGELYKGGRFGFASSHAANTFGIATLFFLLLRKTRKRIGLLFLWALLVTYTRIYLGVHYPGDVIVGAFVGIAAGMISYTFHQWLQDLYRKRQLRSS
jgi:undecaprenyl-diphosphatase